MPTFSEYLEKLRSHRAARLYQLDPKKDYQLNLDDYLPWIERNGLSSALVINPGNPTGQFIPLRRMLQFLERARKLSLVIVDESFVDFAGDPVPSLLGHADAYENLLLVRSMSKHCGVPGLRLGYCYTANQRIQKHLRRVIPVWNINSLAEYFLSLLPATDPPITRPGEAYQRDALARRGARADSRFPCLSHGGKLRPAPDRERLDGPQAPEAASRAIPDLRAGLLQQSGHGRPTHPRGFPGSRPRTPNSCGHSRSWHGRGRRIRGDNAEIPEGKAEMKPRVVVVSRRLLRKNKWVNWVSEIHMSLLMSEGLQPVVVPIPEETQDHLADYARRDGGSLMVEGGDIHPRYYEGESPDTELDELDELKDGYEFWFCRRSLERHVPILGICRGIQLLNVIQGGTLHENVMKEKSSTLKHVDIDDYDDYRHAVRVSRERRSTIGMDSTSSRSTATTTRGSKNWGRPLSPWPFPPTASSRPSTPRRIRSKSACNSTRSACCLPTPATAVSTTLSPRPSKRTTTLTRLTRWSILEPAPPHRRPLHLFLDFC